MQFVLWGGVIICLQYTAGYITANFFVFEHILPLMSVASVPFVIALYKAFSFIFRGGGYEYPVLSSRLTEAFIPHP